MYSAVGVEEVVVTDADDAEIDVPWQDVLPRSRRPELDWTRHLPEALCAKLDEPQVTVTVGDLSRTVAC